MRHEGGRKKGRCIPMARRLWRCGCRSGATEQSVRRDSRLDGFPEANRTLRIEGSAMTERERHLSSPSSFPGWNVFGEISA